MRFGLLLLLSSLLLTSCASPEKRAQRKAGLDNMPGLSVTALYDIYGLPEEVADRPGGETVNTWEHRRSEVYKPYEPRPKPEGKSVLEKVGNSIADGLMGIKKPGDVVERECKLNVTIHNKVVTKAQTDGEFLDRTCDYFLEKWYDYQDARNANKASGGL